MPSRWSRPNRPALCWSHIGPSAPGWPSGLTPPTPDTEVPLEVVNASWEPHVRDGEDGTVSWAAYACCVLGRLRVGLRRRDIYAPGRGCRNPGQIFVLTSYAFITMLTAKCATSCRRAEFGLTHQLRHGQPKLLRRHPPRSTRAGPPTPAGRLRCLGPAHSHPHSHPVHGP